MRFREGYRVVDRGDYYFYHQNSLRIGGRHTFRVGKKYPGKVEVQYRNCGPNHKEEVWKDTGMNRDELETYLRKKKMKIEYCYKKNSGFFGKLKRLFI